MTGTATPGFMNGIMPDLLDHWREKSRLQIYRNDPEAWLSDVLGLRWHKKQREFVASFVETRYTAVKSANGTGKSAGVGQLITWGACVYEPGELLQIASAPTLRQIDETTFAYLQANFGRAKARGFFPPGYINDSLHWDYRPNPRERALTLVLGQKPGDRDIVSTFQGIRAVGYDTDTKTWVFIDEAGGVHPDLFVAAESVTTGPNGKIMAIGNPDNLGTYFQKIFTDPQVNQDWSTHTISVYDLPTITGEIVYEDPEMQRQMLNSGMNTLEWAEQKERAWGRDSARYQSKVLGEFPDADDRSFFSQTAIDTANDTTIVVDNAIPARMGVDLARFGEDDSMAYRNVGGNIRRLEMWTKATANESAARIHRLATENGIAEVTIDAAGLGGPILDQVVAMNDERRLYRIIAALGNERSPDPTRWANARAYWYDMLREAMLAGEVDLDFTLDPQLREEMLILQYDFVPRTGAIKIESKKEMASRGVKSPDALDAVVYAFMDSESLINPLTGGLNPGDRLTFDLYDMAEIEMNAPGLPI